MTANLAAAFSAVSGVVASSNPAWRPSPWRVLGVDDEVTTCELCGKADLKCTVVMEHGDTGEIVRYGRDCAARTLAPRGTGKTATATEMERKARAAMGRAVEEELRARGLLHRNNPVEGMAWIVTGDPRYPRKWGMKYRLNDGRTYLRFDFVVRDAATAARIVPGSWTMIRESEFVGREA